MKIKNILLFFILFFSFSLFNKTFGLQIKNVNYSANNNNDRWIEIFNDGSDILDFTSSVYKIIDSEDETNHRINELSGGISFLASTSIFISPSTNIPQGAEKVFRSPYKLNKGSGYIILDAQGIKNCFSYGGVVCPTIQNEEIVEEDSTSTTSSTTLENDTSTKEKIVYIYIPENNQHKYGDIQILLPEERIVPASAEVEYEVKVTDSKKQIIKDLNFSWSFGDGGQKEGQKVLYHYVYPGEYSLIAEADGYTSGGQARMNVKVVEPKISISKAGEDEKENFILLQNEGEYDLFLSNFVLSLDNKNYRLPKNFLIAKNKSVKVAGEALGFTLPAKNISLLYPSGETLIIYTPVPNSSSTISTTTNTKEEVSEIALLNKIAVDTPLKIEKSIIKNILPTKIVKNSETYKVKEFSNEKSSELENPLILRRLILGDSKSREFVYEQVNKKENLVKKEVSSNVDIKLIKWLKNLIY